MPILPPEIAALVEDGRMCGHCGADVRTNVDPDDVGNVLPDVGDSTGEPTLCAACDAAGKSATDFRHEPEI